MIAYAGRLDYERQQVHTLTIEALDQAEPFNLRLFSTAVVSCMCSSNTITLIHVISFR